MSGVMWRWVIACFAVGVCLLASSAQATEAGYILRGRIVPGKSIGPLKLGMKEEAARPILRKLGGSRLVKHIRKGTETEYIERMYPYDFTAYTVGYLGRPGKRRVVLISSHVDENKTREGVGVGTTEAKLARTYRGLRCRDLYGIPADRRKECLLGSRNRPYTIFVLDGGDHITGRRPRPPQIMRVLVEQPFKRS